MINDSATQSRTSGLRVPPKYQGAIAMLLVAGVYFPSSIGGNIAKSLMFAAFLLLVAVYAYLSWSIGLDEQQLLLFSMPIILALVLATFLSPLHEFGIGVLWTYLPVALLYAMRLHSLAFGRLCKTLFLIVNIANLTLGIGLVLHSETAHTLALTYYSNFFPELLPEMLSLNKPILTFATHSLAGFFIFLFFWLNFRAYLSTRRRIPLAFAICYVLLEPFLLSVTGFGFLFLAFCILFVYFARKRPIALVAVLATFFLFLPSFAHFFFTPIENWSDLSEIIISPIFTAQGQGFLGRYGSQGNNLENLRYLSSHPFSPTGLTTGGNLFIGDSGPIEYLMRGSVPLLALMYVGLFRFLWRNLANRWDVYVLFVAVLAMEVGFTSLIYLRMLYLLPVAIIFLNSTAETSAAASSEIVPTPNSPRLSYRPEYT